MFLTLLLVTFAIAAFVSFAVIMLFRGPINAILGRIVAEDVRHGWWRYLSFAIYVVGISGGVPVGEIERYITPRPEETEPLVLNAQRWTLEVYRTVFDTLQSLALLLLAFFVVTLIAYVVVAGLGLLRPSQGTEKPSESS